MNNEIQKLIDDFNASDEIWREALKNCEYIYLKYYFELNEQKINEIINRPGILAQGTKTYLIEVFKNSGGYYGYNHPHSIDTIFNQKITGLKTFVDDFNDEDLPHQRIIESCIDRLNEYKKTYSKISKLLKGQKFCATRTSSASKQILEALASAGNKKEVLASDGNKKVESINRISKVSLGLVKNPYKFSVDSQAMGFTPNHNDVSYKGAVIWIKPEEFLLMCHELHEESRKGGSISHAKELWNKDGLVAPPQLYMTKRGDQWEVVGHEGRHRATVAMEKAPKSKIPVFIYMQGVGYEITTDKVISLKSVVKCEQYAKSPYFYLWFNTFWLNGRFHRKDSLDSLPITLERVLSLYGSNIEIDRRYYWSDIVADFMDESSGHVADFKNIESKITRNPKGISMKRQMDKVYSIMTKAKKLYEEQKFEKLEEFADEKLDEAVNMIDSAIKSKTRSPFDIEDIRWEIYSTLTGSHFIDKRIAGLRLKMNLNTVGIEPTLSLTDK